MTINLGVIAARGGSKGLPGKNLRLLAGQPLIERTILAAKQSRLLSDFLVTTDSTAIAEVARAAGASVPFLRPPELATDDVPIWPAVLHATEQWEKASGQRADAVVLLQATSPLRISEDIDGCIERFWALKADICSSVIQTYFNLLEPVPNSPGFVRPCSPVMLTYYRRQDAPPVYALNGAVYVVARAVLEALENQFQISRYAMYEMPRSRSIDVDTEDDLEMAEWLMSRSKIRS